MTKILLVEDDKSLREIYSVRLLAEGYTLISSGDGEEALAAAIGEKPDLIISDVMMPKISGFEMLDLLRSNDATKNIPVIMLTALSSEQQRDRGNRLGADRYLIKSQVGIEDIVRTVHEVLGDSNQNRNLDQMQTSVATSAVHPASAASTTAQTSNPQQTSGLFPASTEPVNDATATAPTADANGIDSTPGSDTEVADLSTQSDASTSSIVGLNLGGNDSTNFPALGSTGSNTAEPTNFQSAFNPPAATEPSKVTGQPSPELPDTPMHIPSREATQPGMPNSYTAASQSVANSPFASLANVEPRRPAVPPRPSQPSTQATAGQQPTVNSNQTATQPAQTAQPGQTQAVPAVNQVSAQPSTANAAQYSQPAQAVAPQPAPPVASQPVQQFMTQPPYNQAYAGPQVVAMPSTQPTLQTATSQWGQSQQQTTPPQQPMQAQFIQQPIIAPAGQMQSMQMTQPVAPSAHPAVGGERVVTPPPAGTTVSPRINIDELLASADASAGSPSMFPDTVPSK